MQRPVPFRAAFRPSNFINQGHAFLFGAIDKRFIKAFQALYIQASANRPDMRIWFSRPVFHHEFDEIGLLASEALPLTSSRGIMISCQYGDGSHFVRGG